MEYIELFEAFSKRKKKRKPPVTSSGDTESFDPPEYVVQPAENDTGFFLVKKEFEKMRGRFSPGISFSFADKSAK